MAEEIGLIMRLERAEKLLRRVQELFRDGILVDDSDVFTSSDSIEYDIMKWLGHG